MKPEHLESNHRRTPEYTAWVNMISRCENPKLKHFAIYGGRGIRVCERWRDSYENFLADMGRRPSSGHSLDRIDGDGNYEPGNCRWATYTEQQRNRGNNVRVTIGGESMTLPEWEERTGIGRSTIKQRIAAGRSESELLAPVGTLSAPNVTGAHVLYRGSTYSISELVKVTGIPDVSLRRRLRRHATAEEAVAAWNANGKGKKNLRTDK
jgi:hypothetical protein